MLDDIEDAGLDDVFIVGHSMAGLTAPGVVAKLGAPRVRELILAGACVPPDGAAMVDVVASPVAFIACRNAKKGAPYRFPRVAARFMCLNGVPRDRRRFMARRLYADSSQIPVEHVSRGDEMPADVPCT